MRTSQLRYFCSIVEHASFTLAAQECHVAQPAISQQIKALEQELGFDLLIRTSKGVQPTEAGSRYYQDAANVLRLLDQARRRSSAISLGIEGLLRIGIASSSQAAILDVINRFRFAHPVLDIELHRARSAKIYRQLQHGDYDVLPVATCMLDDENDVRIAARRTSRLVIGMSKSHPLASKKTISIEDVCHYPHIIAASNSDETLYTTYPYLREHPETRLLHAEDQGLGSLMMRLGLGLQAMPVEVAEPEDCAFRAVEGYDADLEIGWAYLAGNDNPALPLFLQFLENQND